MLRNRWSILAVLVFARLAIALQFQSVGSLGADLTAAFAVDYAQLGLLIGLYMLPGTVVAIPGGMLGQHFGAKRVVVCGLGLMAAGDALMASGSAFTLLMAGRLVSGIGAVVLSVLLTKMMTDWFAGRDIATATSLFISSWPLGIALAVVGYGPLAAASDWRIVMLATSAFALVAAAAVAVGYGDPRELASRPPPPGGARLSRREALLVAIASAVWGAYNVAFIVFVSFAPDLLVARGMAARRAAWLVSLVGWSLIPSVPLCGYLADRFGASNAMMFTGLSAVAFALAVLSFPGVTATAVIVIALFIGLPAGLIVALPAGVLRPEVRAVGMGVFFTGYYAMMALLPGIAGMLRDVAGLPAPILFAAAMMVLACAGVAAFRAIQRSM